MQKTIVGRNQAGQRFDKFLAKYLSGATKSFIYKMLRKKNITLNGKKASGNEILSENDSVETFFSDETFAKFSSVSGGSSDNSDNKLNIQKKNSSYKPAVVYADSDIIIFDKPAGMLSQKAEKNDYSLNEYLIDHCMEEGIISSEELKTFKPSVCNRLDRNTSGLVLCGVSLKGLQTLTRIIRERKIGKYYLTVCHGKIEKSFSSKGYLKKDEKNNTVSIISQENAGSLTDPDSVYIETDFRPLENFGDKATLLEVMLHTGKSHQIRAQLSALGHPIYGDKKYISLNNNVKFGKEPEEKRLKHQLLQAYKVVFPEDMLLPSDPVFKKDEHTIEIPPSKEISKLISELTIQRV